LAFKVDCVAAEVLKLLRQLNPSEAMVKVHMREIMQNFWSE
jgi:hypothetical protein